MVIRLIFVILFYERRIASLEKLCAQFLVEHRYLKSYIQEYLFRIGQSP